MKPLENYDNFNVGSRLFNSKPLNQLETSCRHEQAPLGQRIENLCRHRWISEAAYFLAETRNFEPGFELDDWLKAEHLYNRHVVDLCLPVFHEDGDLTIAELKQLANAIGLVDLEEIASKNELIQLIQIHSGCVPCFKSAKSEACDNRNNCQWRLECLQMLAEWQR